MRPPDENTIQPDIKPGPSGKALEDFQAGGGDYPRGTTYSEPGYGELEAAPPARSSDDALSDERLVKKGLAPSKAADPPICHWDANAPQPDLTNDTSDV